MNYATLSCISSEEADGDGAEGQLVLAPLHEQGSAACEAQPRRPQRRLRTRLTQVEMVLEELRWRCWAGRVGGGKEGTEMDSSSTRPRFVTLPSFFFAAKLRRRVAAEAVT